jgi:hypothetical protein
MERAGRLPVGSLAIVIPLSVRPTSQPGLGENPVLDFALLLKCDLVLEHVNLGRQAIRNAVAQLLGPMRITRFHLNTLNHIGIRLIDLLYPV